MAIHTYNHAEVDRIWGIEGIYQGSFKDHIRSTSGWLYTHAYTYIGMKTHIHIIYAYAYEHIVESITPNIPTGRFAMKVPFGSIFLLRTLALGGLFIS